MTVQLGAGQCNFLVAERECLFDIFKCAHTDGLKDIGQWFDHWTSAFKSSCVARRSSSV